MLQDFLVSYELLAADIWAIGIMFDELLRGEYFFFHDEEEMFAKQLQNKRYENIPEEKQINYEIQGIISDCLNKTPENRPKINELLVRMKNAKSKYYSNYQLPAFINKMTP